MLWVIIKTSDAVADRSVYDEYFKCRYGDDSIKISVLENGSEGNNPHFNYVIDTYNEEVAKGLRDNMTYKFKNLKGSKKLSIKRVDDADGLMVYLLKEDDYVLYHNSLYTDDQMLEFKKKSYPKTKKEKTITFSQLIVDSYEPPEDGYDRCHIVVHILNKYKSRNQPHDMVMIKRLYYGIKNVYYFDTHRKDVFEVIARENW